MKLFNKDLTTEIAIIAEIGVNHEGDADIAHKLMELAATSGVDAVKFQSYTPSRYASSDDAERLKKVTSFALSEDDFTSLSNLSKKLDICFFSTPVSEDWVGYLSSICDVIKIASGDINFEPVIRAAAASGCKVIISTGTANIDEIDNALAWFKDELNGINIEDRLVLMHCVSAYPVPICDANLLSIPFLIDRYFPITIGYSNHVLGVEAALGAVALGARVIEMHFTDNKYDRQFRDHALSADPDDMAYLVEKLPEMAKMRGKLTKQAMPAEKPLINIIRKGVSAAQDLPAGKILAKDDLSFTRPATEIAAADIKDVIGKKLIINCKGGQSIKWEWLDNIS